MRKVPPTIWPGFTDPLTLDGLRIKLPFRPIESGFDVVSPSQDWMNAARRARAAGLAVEIGNATVHVHVIHTARAFAYFFEKTRT